jgi:hypothetical protein
MRTARGILAFACLAFAVAWQPWERTALGLVLLLVAFAVVISQLGGKTRESPAVTGRALVWGLPVLIGAELICLYFTGPSTYLVPAPGIGLTPGAAYELYFGNLSHQLKQVKGGADLFRLPVLYPLGLGAIGLVMLGWTLNYPRWARWRFTVALAMFLALGSWLVAIWPKPAIDVWNYQQGACRALAAGTNPYRMETPNPYGPAWRRYLGEAVVKNGKVQSFPYPPFSLLLVFPGYLLGDVRWCLLGAIAASAALMVATGRRLGLPPGHPAELAAVAFLCHPRGLLVLEMAWTETLVAACTCLAFWALAGARGRGLALGTVLAVKQYGVLWLPAWAAVQRISRRELMIAVLFALVWTVPFFLWGPAAMWRGLMEFQLQSPFRPDAMSVTAAVKAVTGWEPWSGLSFVAAAAVAGLLAWRRPGSLSGCVYGGAAIYLAFFLMGKQAFLNYYYYTAAIASLGIVVAAAEALALPGRRPKEMVPCRQSAKPV